MELDVPAIDSLAVVRAYRENYVNFYMLWDQATGVPDGVRLVTPAEMDRPEVKELLQPDLSKWLK